LTKAFWRNTFESQLCGALWLSREDAESSDLRSRLETEWPAFREALIARAAEWRAVPQYESIAVSLDEAADRSWQE
jgi:hypothetical protein